MNLHILEQKYCYENGNGVSSFNTKTINKNYTNKYNELVTSKPTTVCGKNGHTSKRTQQKAIRTTYVNNNEVATEIENTNILLPECSSDYLRGHIKGQYRAGNEK